MKIQSKIISRIYVVSQKEIKEKLNIKGNIKTISLWSGLSPLEKEQEESCDTEEWEITTHE